MVNSWLKYVYLYLSESNSIHFLINRSRVEWLRDLKLLRTFTCSTSDVLESGLHKWYARTILNYKYGVQTSTDKTLRLNVYIHIFITSRVVQVLSLRAILWF